MTQSPTILTYAEPSKESRHWSRTAIASLAWVLAYPLVIAMPLLYAVHENWLPQHFLCCNHPEVAALAFVITPLAGMIWGCGAAVKIARDQRRPRPRGTVLAVLAIVIGAALALLGIALRFALKT